MATNKELETQVKALTQQVARVQASNSDLRDELVIMKNNYVKLVEQLTERLEAVHTRFRANN